VSFLLSRILNCRTPIPRDILTRILVVNGSDLIGKSRVAISCCTISLPSKTPMNQTPKVPDPLPPILANGWPRLILGVLGLMMSWFSCPRGLRFPNSRPFGISCHVSLGSTAYDGVGNSCIAVSYCKGSCL
jgi:hypothetical protein